MDKIDPTQPLPLPEAEKQENKRNPSWIKPGEVRNPHGRPIKGYSITEAFKKMLGEKPEVKTAMVNQILKAALEGDMTAAKMIWSYMDGQPLQVNENSVKGDFNVFMGREPIKQEQE